MGDNQKEAPASNFDLAGDGSTMYDSDSQIRTAIIRRLLNEYRTTNYFLVNAMQSTFLRFFIPDPYNIPPEYNRPKSDSDYYKPKNNDHLKIEELNIKLHQVNDCCFDNNTMSKLNDRSNDTFRSEFDTISSNSQQESELVTGRTMHVDYPNSCYSADTEKDFQFVNDFNNQGQQFEDKQSSFRSTDSMEDNMQNFTPFFPQWKKINKGKDKIQNSAHSSRRGEKAISCTFNDSNRSSIDKYNDDTNNSFDRRETNSNKGKCKSEFISKSKTDKKSNNNNNNNDNNSKSNKSNSNDEYKMPQRRETKWQVFCELYEELNSSIKEQNSDYASTSSESIKSSIKNYDSRKTSSHSSLERKINEAINKLKDKESDASNIKKMLKNTENLKLKFNNRFNNKKPYEDDTSSDTEEVLVRNRYLRNKRIYNTKKYLSNKFRKTVRKRKNQIELLTSTTSSDDNEFFTSRQNVKADDSETSKLNTSPIQTEDGNLQLDFQQQCAENSFKMKQFQQKCAEPSYQQHFDNYPKMFQLQQMSSSSSDKMPQPQQKCFHSMPQPQVKCSDPSYKMPQPQQKYHKMNDKLIHETIFENSEEEPYPHPPFPSYFQKFMDKYNKNHELIHKKGCTNLAAKFCQESGTITCDDYSKNNQSFNLNETSCVQANNSNVSIDNDNIANSGHSTSSFDSINDKSVPLPCTASNSEDTHTQRNRPEDLTKMSASTICLKSSNGAVDSGLGASVSEIKPIENVFIIKKPRNQNLDDIVLDKSALVSSSTAEWSKICKAKISVSKLPFSFSSSSKSKSSSDNDERIKCKPKMRVIFKREATVIDLYNSVSGEETPVLKLNEKNGLDLRKKKWFCCFRHLCSCCNQ